MKSTEEIKGVKHDFDDDMQILKDTIQTLGNIMLYYLFDF